MSHQSKFFQSLIFHVFIPNGKALKHESDTTEFFTQRELNNLELFRTLIAQAGFKLKKLNLCDLIWSFQIIIFSIELFMGDLASGHLLDFWSRLMNCQQMDFNGSF